MPKSVNNIFYNKLKFSKMLDAYERSSKNKHKCKEVIMYELDLANNLIVTLKQLYSGTYKVGLYRQFRIYEPKACLEERGVHSGVKKLNKKKIKNKIKKWNKLYYNKKLDLKNTTIKLNSWIGHAQNADTFFLVNKMIRRCEWLYNENTYGWEKNNE